MSKVQSIKKMVSVVSDQIFIWGIVADLFYLIAIDTVHVHVYVNVSRSLESYSFIGLIPSNVGTLIKARILHHCTVPNKTCIKISLAF